MKSSLTIRLRQQNHYIKAMLTIKTSLKSLILLFLISFTFQSCQDDDDISAPLQLEVQDFVWKGLNRFYLWQADVPNLDDNRFASQTQLNSFLKGYPNPSDLFDALLVDSSIDRFSWFINDYTVQEQAFQGTTKNNGIEFGLYLKPGSSTAVFGWVRYIIPNSDAAAKDIKRGDIFYAVDGIPLTTSNYQSLLYSSKENYTLEFADYNNATFTPNGKSIAFTKTVLNENPILINKVIETGSHKIGYLMYNGFYSSYDTKLNEAFGTLKTQGITDLVLDLRYNPGGAVHSATRLASMITGQLTGKVFSKLEYNEKLKSKNTNYLFTNKIGDTPINSLNLTKVYILTTKGTASASELIINGLRPHINVVHIGDLTAGKNVASITVYDSQDFSATNRNPNHRYAMQPIVAKSVNAIGFGEYTSGLIPDFSLNESLGNPGVLGSTTEPLLSAAIGKITGTGKMTPASKGINFKFLSDSKIIRGQNEMHIEKIPEDLLKN